MLLIAVTQSPVAATQRKFAKTWQMHRANKEAKKEENDAVKTDKEVRCCCVSCHGYQCVGGKGRSKMAHSDKVVGFPYRGSCRGNGVLRSYG